MNLQAASSELRSALTAGFSAQQHLSEWPEALTQRLVAERYSRDAWNIAR